MSSTSGRETERRRAIAHRVVEVLAARTELRASLLAGSAAEATSDEHSDVDLLNYYDRLPTRAAFDAAIGELGADGARLISDAEDGYVSSYRLDGVEVQTGAEPIACLERRLLLIEAGDVDWVSAKTAAGLLHGVALHGAELVAAWQRRARYPESLRRREVERNLAFFPVWAIDDHLAARDAELFRRQMLLDGAFRVLAVLSAVNRLYFTSFQFKRAGVHAEHMTSKPARLAERLDRVANAPPSEAAEELRRLVEETKAIVAAEMPGTNADVAWRPGV